MKPVANRSCSIRATIYIYINYFSLSLQVLLESDIILLVGKYSTFLIEICLGFSKFLKLTNLLFEFLDQTVPYLTATFFYFTDNIMLSKFGLSSNPSSIPPSLQLICGTHQKEEKGAGTDTDTSRIDN